MRLQWMKRNSLAVLVIGLAAGLAQAGELTVSAAASLTNAFKEIAQDYEAQHAGTKVLLNFGASGALLQQMAKGALDKAGLWSAIEAKAVGMQNVRQSLDYVTRGEVDAGFVYATDAAVMKEKVRVAFEVRVDTPILYPIARTAGGANAEEAGSFVAHVLSPAGQAVLSKHGFQKP